MKRREAEYVGRRDTGDGGAGKKEKGEGQGRGGWK